MCVVPRLPAFVCVCCMYRCVCACACSCNIVDNFALFAARGHRSAKSMQYGTNNAAAHPVMPCLPCALPHPVYAVACVTRLLLAPGRVHTHTHTHTERYVYVAYYGILRCVTQQVTQKNSMSHVVATWLSFSCCSAPSLPLSLSLTRSRQHRPLRIRRVGQLPALPCRVAYTQRWRSED